MPGTSSANDGGGEHRSAEIHSGPPSRDDANNRTEHLGMIAVGQYASGVRKVISTHPLFESNNDCTRRRNRVYRGRG
jgi:hypothetical protein